MKTDLSARHEPRCPYCFEPTPGDPEAGIEPGDELADHLTDEHQSLLSEALLRGLTGNV